MYQHGFFASSLNALGKPSFLLATILTIFLRTRQRPQHLLLPKLLHLKPTHPIIPIDVPATNPPLPRKATPPMQHSPVIEHHHPPGRQLLPILILRALQQRIQLARRRVPGADLLNGHLDARAVRRVPPYTQQLASGGVVLEYREPTVWHDTNSLVRILSHVRPPFFHDAKSSDPTNVNDERFLRRVKNESPMARTGFDLDREEVVQAVFSATKDELSQERIQEIANCLPGRVRELWEQA